jgi:hypothetical protein
MVAWDDVGAFAACGPPLSRREHGGLFVHSGRRRAGAAAIRAIVPWIVSHKNTKTFEA